MRLSVDRLHKCEVDPELLRGISMMTLLRSDTFQGHDLAGKSFDDNAAHRLYACSRPTGQLDLFVSHSWRASSSGKWLALNVRMNGSTAAVASVVVAGALAAARRQGLLPAGGGYRDEHLDERLEFGVPYALLGGLGAFVFCLFFAHRVGCVGEQSAFCDKMCVHQTDAYKKQAAIDSFSGFIGKSREMVVLWSPEYFRRLWCTFEIASFLHIQRNNPDAKLTILPLLLNDVMLVSFCCLLVYCLLVVALLASGAWDGVERSLGSRAGEALVLCGLAFVPLTWLAAAARAYARDRDAALDDLERFSIRDAGVFLESDRDVVTEVINKWFVVESEDGAAPPEGRAMDFFDRSVRGFVRNRVARSLGVRTAGGGRCARNRPLPYARGVLASFPAFWLGLDYLASLRPAPARLQLSLAIPCVVTVPFLLLPTLAFLVFAVSGATRPPTKKLGQVAPLDASGSFSRSRRRAKSAAEFVKAEALVFADPVNVALGGGFTALGVALGTSVSAAAYVAPPYGSVVALAACGAATAAVYGESRSDAAAEDRAALADAHDKCSI